LLAEQAVTADRQAVVRREDHDRVPIELQFLERVQQPSNLLVEPAD
jgi:hypothetical protein